MSHSLTENIATACVDDISARVADVDGVTGKVFSVLSPDDLSAKTKHIKSPSVGVIYNGITPIGSGDPQNKGMGGICNISVVLFVEGSGVGNLDLKNEAARLLDLMRFAIRRKDRPTEARSPSGHYWRFSGEQPAGNVGRYSVYVQKWSTMVTVNT